MISFEQFLAETADGRSPYPWQSEFAVRTAAGRLPETIGVPTGCGKTTVVHALVWALASQADRPVADRTAHVRTVWAIDRRILVDEVFDQASQLAERLDQAWRGGPDGGDPLYEVAARLQSLKAMPDEDAREVLGRPLETTRWRGGMALDLSPSHPMQAEVITSTVAQIGSRLLFRGYGLGRRSLSLGAALSACDTTICLDEAHLAEPLMETARQIAEIRESDDPVTPGLSVISLTATSRDTGDVLNLSEADRDPLAARLGADKRARLVVPTGNGDKEQEAAILEAAQDHLERETRVLACICNSVRSARAVFDRLGKTNPDVDRVLLVGPQRPADREVLFHKQVGEAGPTRREVLFNHASAPVSLVVVATQTVEVGLDIDVDAMVTQSASASALIQRFGRLNRRGGADRVGLATVIRQQDFPLYADDSLEEVAWEWLRALPKMTADGDWHDISVDSILSNPAPVPPPRRQAPELTPETVDLLTCTNPLPADLVDPEIEAYLAGTEAETQADVTLCWRADLNAEMDSDEASVYRKALLDLVPAQQEEQLTLSLAAARNLLRSLTGRSRARGLALQRQVLGGADLEGAAPDEAVAIAPESAKEALAVPFLVQRGPDLYPDRYAKRDELRVADLQPGDLIILPTSLGGADDYGLAPASEEAPDVALDLRLGVEIGSRSYLPVRLTTEALSQAYRGRFGEGQDLAVHIAGLLRRTAEFEQRLAAADSESDLDQIYLGLVEHFADHPAIESLDRKSIASVDLRRITSRSEMDLDVELGLDGEPDSAGESMEFLPGESDSSPADAWVLTLTLGQTESDRDKLRPKYLGGDPPTVADHCRAVAQRVESFAKAAGLEDRLIATLRLAGLAHDLGKTYPPMQRFFRGGLFGATVDPIAKSVFGTADRQADRAARDASGLPSHWRHELASVEILRQHLEGVPEMTDVDRALLLHICGAHHGQLHPIPPVPKPEPVPVHFTTSLDGISGSATGDADEGWQNGEAMRRRMTLSARYGSWGLAYLESLLVLADRSVSAEGR